MLSLKEPMTMDFHMAKEKSEQCQKLTGSPYSVPSGKLT